MKIQKTNSISTEKPKPVYGRGVVVPSAILSLVFIISCSLLGEAQPSTAATADQSTSTVFSLPSPTFTAEPSPSESPTLIPTVTWTRKPTRTPTTIFNACAEVTGMTSEEIQDFINQIKDFIANDKRAKLAGLGYY